MSVKIGGHIPVSQTAAIIDTFVLPWDCYVLGVDRSYVKTGTNHLDAVALKTVDATALSIVALGDLSADIAGVAQTLHADIIGVKLVKGNKIQLTADTAADEAGTIYDTVHLRPAYS
ncbi:MAG: hypothetical protein ACKV2Q_36490 [Planctomycetaceae bacterium]